MKTRDKAEVGREKRGRKKGKKGNRKKEKG